MPVGERRLRLALLTALVTVVGIEVGARIVEAVRDAFVPAASGETAFAVLANPAPAFERATVDGRELYRRTKAHSIGRIGNLRAGRGTAMSFVGVLITVGGGTLQSTGIG